MKSRKLMIVYKMLIAIVTLLPVFLCFSYSGNVDLTSSSISFVMPDHDVTLNARSQLIPTWWWGGGGWWGWSINRPEKDDCPNWDNSSSLYDWKCEDDVQSWTGEDSHGSAENWPCSIDWSVYTYELNWAYQYACRVWITTMDTIQKADMVWPLLRKHLAKMASEFAMNELWMEPDKSKVCKFNDMWRESSEMQKYAEIACQLWFMGLHSDGIQVKDNFDPNDQVTRAEFGTVLSRLLWWTKYATDDGDLFYKKHLEALRENGIMTQIYGNWPSSIELRWYVMLMLKRVSELDSDIVHGSPTDEAQNESSEQIDENVKVDEWNVHVSFQWFKNWMMTTTWDYVRIIWALDPSQPVVSIRVTHTDTKWQTKITNYKLSKYEAAAHYFWFNASKANKSLTMKDRNTYLFEFYDANDKLLFKKSVVIVQK